MMTVKTRLASLTLDRFRGASQRVTIPFSDKPITLLFGENGSGKSSIIDGLEFVLKGNPGSISDISGASPGSHLPTLNAKTKEVLAEVRLEDGSLISSTISGNKITQKSDGPSPCPNATFLRRSRILQLITAQSGKRYEALASFIDVSGVETSEDFLGKAIIDQKKSLELTTTKVLHATEELQRLFSEQAAPDEKSAGFEPWAAKQASQDITQLKATVDSLASVIKDYASSEKALTEANDQQSLLETKRAEQKTAQEAFEEAVKKAPGAVDLLINLLIAGKDYVEAVQEVAKCPLCSNRTTRSLLIAEIEAKLGTLPGVQAVKKVRDTANEAVTLATAAMWPFYIRLLQAARSLLLSIKNIPEEYRTGLNPDEAEFSVLRTLPEIVKKNDVPKDRNASAKSLLLKAAGILPRCKEEHAKLDPRKTLLSSIQTHYKSLVDGRKEAKTSEKVRDHLQAMLDVIRPIRQQFVQDTLESVSSDCDDLYADIHPDEPYGKIRLLLDTEKRASCDLTADFCGNSGVPPQAYYSESHMDTLGFSLFFALAKRGGGRDTLIVLDDIFTSVDDQHLDRVCRLLSKEAANLHQIILATHIRKILDWVRSGHLPQNVYGLVELSSQWSLKDGIRAQQATLDREDIEQLLNAPFLDRTALAGKVRRFLEALLGNIVISLGARAPMKKFGEYELSDYLCGLLSLTKDGYQIVRTHNPAGVLREPHSRESYELRTKAKEFNESKNIVNKLVHAAEEGASYSDDEAREFAREVLQLERYLRCDNPNCGSIIGTNKSFMTCKCGEWKWGAIPATKV